MQPVTTRILLVEDNPGDARLARLALGRCHPRRYDLEHVESLDHALRQLQCESFDAVLLDLNLPDSDAFETLREVIGSSPGLPVVVLSGQDNGDMIGRAVEAGAQDYVLKDELMSELGNGRLTRVVNYAIQRNDEKLRLSKYALYDEVTELPTRRLLRDRWAGAKARARRENAWVGVLVIDLDEFKAVNDRLGHAGGDLVLKVTADRLQSAVRQNDTVARVGGDEFVVLLETIRGIEDAQDVAEKLRLKLLDQHAFSSAPLIINASIGAGVCQPDQADDLQDLVERADLEMYREKRKKAKSRIVSVA